MAKGKKSALETSEELRALGLRLEQAGRALVRLGATAADQCQALTDARWQAAVLAPAAEILQAAQKDAGQALALAQALAEAQAQAQGEAEAQEAAALAQE